MNAGRWKATARVGATALLVAGLVSCARQSPPQKPFIHTTKTFDSVFGALPQLGIPGPCHAAVAYFPSARDQGKFRPAPVFSAEQGKEEFLAVRTVVRGVESKAFSEEVAFPFPPGSDLESLSRKGGVAWITVGGTFRATEFSRGQGSTAAKALALTVAQFGEATEADLSDAEGKVHFTARADDAQTVDAGPPKVLGLLAVREKRGEPPAVLAVLFDRPVFVDDFAIYPPGGRSPYLGKAYSTGFGMTVEFHPEPQVAFDANGVYRVRLAIRDGKGRKASEDREWTPLERAGG